MNFNFLATHSLSEQLKLLFLPQELTFYVPAINQRGGLTQKRPFYVERKLLCWCSSLFFSPSAWVKSNWMRFLLVYFLWLSILFTTFSFQQSTKGWNSKTFYVLIAIRSSHGAAKKSFCDLKREFWARKILSRFPEESETFWFWK